MSKKPMTDMEVMLKLARESLERYGTALPPLAEMRAPKAKKQAAEPAVASVDFTKIRKLCPHCEKTKYVLPDFGVTNDRGKLRPQGRCRACRSSVNYHTKPRVYDVGPRKSTRR